MQVGCNYTICLFEIDSLSELTFTVIQNLTLGFSCKLEGNKMLPTSVSPHALKLFHAYTMWLAVLGITCINELINISFRFKDKRGKH